MSKRDSTARKLWTPNDGKMDAIPQEIWWPMLQKNLFSDMGSNFNGHFRNLNWRYLPYIIKACAREYPPKIWPTIWHVVLPL